MPGVVSAVRTPARPVRVAGIAVAAVVLTGLFIYLGFPYESLAGLVAGRVESGTGYRIAYGPVGASLGLLGPGIAVEDLRVRAPNGDSWEFSRVRLRPAWSLSWLRATPAIHVDAESELGRLRGVAIMAQAPGFDGEAEGIDLATLLRDVAPGSPLSGTADIFADVRMAAEGPEGRVSLTARDGVLSHPRLPMDVPYQQIDGAFVLGGEHAVEIVSLDVRSQLGSGSITGTVAGTRPRARARIDLAIAITVSEQIRGALSAQGVRLGQDGTLQLQVTGTVANPQPVRR